MKSHHYSSAAAVMALVVGASLTTAPGAALAQTAAAAPTPATPAAKKQTDAGVVEVVVTAQKRSEKLINVPIAITAVTPTLLNQTASKNLQELQGVVPGVTFPEATSYGGAPTVIRGTSGSGTFLEDDPVAVYVDGIYQASNSRFGVSDLTDVQSVEIVRGPQGTLQGRNATAGAILVHSTDPGSVFGGFVRTSIATPSEYRVEAAVTIPLGDTLGVRLSGDHYDQGGWAYNLQTGKRVGGQIASNLRAVVLWKPTSIFSARLALNNQSLSNEPAAARWAYTTVNPSGEAVTNPTPYTPLPASLQNLYLKNDNVDMNFYSRNTQTSPNGALEMHLDLGPVELVSLTGASWAHNNGTNDSDGLGTQGTNGVSLVDSVTGNLRQAYNQALVTGNQVTEEFRIQSTATTPFKWLVGVFGSRANDNMNFQIFNLDESVATNERLNFLAHQKDTSLSYFADGTYAFNDQFSFTAGVRQTKEDKLFNNEFTVTILPINLKVADVPYAPPKGEWTDTSYRTNLTYKPSSSTMMYVSYSKGFKSGGYNAFGVGPNPSFNPEILYSAELGAKTYFDDHKGYMSASIYNNNYDNLQVTSGVPSGGVIVHNAASAKIKGLEVEGQVRLTPELSVSGNASYTDAHYTSFQNAQGVGGELLDASGNALPNTPKFQYYLEGDYKMDMGGDWSGRAQLSWRWRDKIYFFGTNENSNLIGGQDGELGARLEMTHSATGVTVSLYGKNLTNTRIVSSEQVQFGYPVAYFNEPRVVGIQLAKSF